MTRFKIERGVALPRKHHGGGGRTVKYPFGEMIRGDSFLVSGDRDEKARSRVASAASWYSHRHPEFKFAVRVMKDGIRVFCTKSPKKGK